MKKRKLASALGMKLKLSYQSGKKMESREDKGSVKIWELDSSVESDADDSSDSLEYHPGLAGGGVLPEKLGWGGRPAS